MSFNGTYPTSTSSEAPVTSNDSREPPTDAPALTASEAPQRETNAEAEGRKSKAAEEADRKYEERIEDEYAKREGGA
jgi:hypothetical protein